MFALECYLQDIKAMVYYFDTPAQCWEKQGKVFKHFTSHRIIELATGYEINPVTLYYKAI